MILRTTFIDIHCKYWRDKRALDHMKEFALVQYHAGNGGVEEMRQYTDKLEEEHLKRVAADPNYFW